MYTGGLQFPCSGGIIFSYCSSLGHPIVIDMTMSDADHELRVVAKYSREYLVMMFNNFKTFPSAVASN